MILTAGGVVPKAVRTGAKWRLGLVLLGGLSLISGLDAALLRLDVWAPVAAERLGQVHGQVMVLGFLGTLISLERAQALGRSWGYLAPALFGLGALTMVVGLPPSLGQLLQVEASLLFVGVYVALWRRAPRTLVALQVLSAVFVLAGTVIALAQGLSAAVPWLICFLVLTIATERAELAQLVLGPGADRVMLRFAAALSLAATAAQLWPAIGDRLLGLVLFAGALWLLWHDVVRHQLRLSGQRRYLATALLLGYLWLIFAGLVLASTGLNGAPGSYDLVVHAVFLGFGMSMVMAHAPIILPAVLGRELPYNKVLWIGLCLLHLGLLLRAVGDLGAGHWWWQVGGVTNVIALLAFLLSAVWLVVRR